MTNKTEWTQQVQVDEYDGHAEAFQKAWRVRAISSQAGSVITIESLGGKNYRVQSSPNGLPGWEQAMADELLANLPEGTTEIELIRVIERSNDKPSVVATIKLSTPCNETEADHD